MLFHRRPESPRGLETCDPPTPACARTVDTGPASESDAELKLCFKVLMRPQLTKRAAQAKTTGAVLPYLCRLYLALTIQKVLYCCCSSEGWEGPTQGLCEITSSLGTSTVLSPHNYCTFDPKWSCLRCAYGLQVLQCTDCYIVVHQLKKERIQGRWAKPPHESASEAAWKE